MANSQLVNILKTSGYNATYPFPEVTSTNPCPQFMLMTGIITGGYTISDVIPLPGNGNTTTGGATANSVVVVEFWTGNQRQAEQLYLSQSLATVQGAT